MRRTQAIESAVLAAMSGQPGPLGARAAARDLRDRGFDVSESTVSRLLKDLDDRALTVSCGKKGRVLTSEGRQLAANLMLDSQRDSYFANALNIRDVDELLDLLSGRRGIEREAARAAALRASAEELTRLQEMFDTPSAGPWHEPLNFHKAIGEMSHNKTIQAITNALFDERLDPLEHLLVLIGIKAGTHGKSDAEHRSIISAIADRDADAAERFMVAHLDSMIRTTEEFARGKNGHVLQAFLAEIDSA